MNGKWYAAALVCAIVIIGVAVVATALPDTTGNRTPGPEVQEQSSGDELPSVTVTETPPDDALPPVAVKGYPIALSGTGGGTEPVAVWLIGREYFERTLVEPGGDEDSVALSPETTAELRSGRYFVVVQERGENGVFDLDSASDDDGIVIRKGGEAVATVGNRSSITGASAQGVRDAVVEAFETSGVDDTVTTQAFLLEEPWIRVDGAESGPIAGVSAGETFTVSGTTNLPAGEPLTAAFGPVEAVIDDLTVVPLTVSAGDPYNAWSFELDTAGLEPGEHYLIVGPAAPNALWETTVVFTVTAE
jgi:hypothetical protein